MSETKFCTHTEPKEKLQSCILQFFILYIADGKTKGSGLNGTKHYQNSVSSEFPPESNFDLLLSLYHGSSLHAGDETAICTFLHVYF
jgi:hypothetical protein